MPLTTTIKDIKAYQEKVEKNKITPIDLPPCPRCSFESLSFKIHAYRERRFLVIVKMLVKAIFCTLVRFRCPNCGKTITNYPDFAIPHKHYTRQTIESFSRSYVDDDHKTYDDAVMTDEGMPERQDTGRSLSPSTIHRWITTLADLIMAYELSLQNNCFSSLFKNLSQLIIPKRKYKTSKRKEILLKCRCFFRLESFLKYLFSPSLP